MPTHRPRNPPLPSRTRTIFDPFNSSSTGHQRAENRLSGSTSWRDSRTHKLTHQLRDATGRGGQQHLSDLVGAGSEHFNKDGRKEQGDWEVGAPGLREEGWQDIRGLMHGSRKRLVEDNANAEPTPREKRSKLIDRRHEDTASDRENLPPESGKQANVDVASTSPSALQPPPQIFRNLRMYLNGSTAPLISDHQLKHLFAQHGGNTSIALGRRTVTHVILGSEHAVGGGLANGKIDKEVKLVRGLGKGVKYVTAQWVVDSVEKGVRQPESRYVPKGVEGRLGGSGQASIRGMFTPGTK
ncbi:BRCA1 C Terminus (BRCT) domain containing protein [Cladophialophora carrionii]|uniref:BRCA1 C Terminus (BRCT) domain containing protein n=1 Tax=Cladophialophora carrionii TaxID=86049 RepID=A0A1C1D1Q3_9EURO|nr:BRCA1 C Terminus (BRCT) domain containing protein [Cladophialophora carrionii]